MNCPICESTSETFIELSNVPIFCNVLYNAQLDALECPRGDIILTHCNECNHIFNVDFDSNKMNYSETYENNLGYSKVFRKYDEKIAKNLIQKYDIKNKHVIDIGCGRGDFLILLSNLGNNTGTGFDQSYQSRPHTNKVQFIREFYTDKYKQHADLVCCRHVLEHIEHPKQFLRDLPIDKETIVLFEVPNALYTLKDKGIWDILYEHVSYFTPDSLRFLFSSLGFKINELRQEFGNQYLVIEAQRGVSKPTKSDMQKEIQSFKQNYNEKVTYWNQLVNTDKKIVVWGAGTKGVMFLNTIKNNIKYIVDLNPAKQGKYVAGSGQKIVSPEFLKTYNPDIVIIMNPNYEAEIKDMLTKLNLSAKTILA